MNAYGRREIRRVRRTDQTIQKARDFMNKSAIITVFVLALQIAPLAQKIPTRRGVVSAK
jgi:hypothetical protein